ncbi:ATP-dependent helicase [Salinifilum ghardaiensis]
MSQQVSPQRIAQALGLPAPTEEQAAVVAAEPQPALVVAGAGAGKTETMAARVVWLVANQHVEPERVLGLTFTRKAARQLADRVRARLRRLAGSGLLDEVDPSRQLSTAVLAAEPTVLTYHAYAGRLVAEHGLRIPVEPGARLLTGTAAWQLAHRVVATWTEDLDTDRIPATVTQYVLSLAGELAEHLVEPQQVRAHAEELCRVVESAPRAKGQRADLPQELRRVTSAQRLRAALLPLVEEYARTKRREGAMDFADQMSFAARLALQHPEVVAGERARFGAVLLDEYQDTGHAQRELLRALYGRGDPLPVTSVGDPVQAIYGWRGASAANLPRFSTDFPHLRQGQRPPAPRYGLVTSFRNPPEVLRLANAVSQPLRESGVDVPDLRARPDADAGDVQLALAEDVRQEREWVAEQVAARWKTVTDEQGAPPTTAVLVRRRADMADMAAALRAQGLPVEVVGLGGLLDEPEVRDLVSVLRMLVDPLAGTAAMRVLTGSRWRLGAADLVALHDRARELGTRVDPPADADASAAVTAALPGENAEQSGLVDALDDPGEPERYSAAGYRRVRELGRELERLRGRLDRPLPELVADVERELRLDIESTARPGTAGRVQLDAFADVVTEFATASPAAGLSDLLHYLDAAERAEDGLEPGEVEVAADRVQVLTMHAAKGLEWEVVALPHLVRDVFPARRKGSCWLRSVTELPAQLRGDAVDLPRLDTAQLSGLDRKELQARLSEHDEEFEDRRLAEERRLLYVALTRSERVLLLSGHWWAETGERPKGPSEFLTELAELCGPSGEVQQWVPAPGEEAENPLTAEVRSARWPADPLEHRRAAVAEGAERVRRAMARLDAGEEAVPGERPLPEEPPPPEEEPPLDEPPPEEEPPLVEPQAEPAAPGGAPHDAELDAPPEPPEPPAEGGAPAEPPEPVGPGGDADDPEGWAHDVDVLLAERSRGRRRERVRLPERLSVSQLVELARDPDRLAERLRRPLPFPPNRVARRGTEFHEWLENRFGSNALLDLGELPGAADDAAEEGGEDVEFTELRRAFERSGWADRTPHRVEVPFETRLAGVLVRGRMDAVFADADGGWTVVDWKTGRLPEGEEARQSAVQLSAYRVAWSELSGTPLERVRAAFHYVRAERTVRPEELLDAEGLAELVRDVPDESAADGSAAGEGAAGWNTAEPEPPDESPLTRWSGRA